jgi:hypothetical protein
MVMALVVAAGPGAARPGEPSARTLPEDVTLTSAVTAAPADDAAIDRALARWAEGGAIEARAAFARLGAGANGGSRARVFSVAAAEVVDRSVRDAFHAADAARSELDARDASILDTLAPDVAEPPDLGEASRRVDALVAHWPNDRVVRLVAAQHAVRAADTTRAFALAASPGMPPAFDAWLGARVRLARGEVDEGRRLLHACLERAPRATDCIAWLAHLDAAEGLCAEGEALDERLSALGVPSDAGGASTPLEAAVRAALFDGAFDDARARIAEWMSATKGAAAEERARALMAKVAIEEEVGAEAEVEARAGWDAGRERQRTSWDVPSGMGELGMTLEGAALAYRAGALSAGAYARARRDALARQGYPRPGTWAGPAAGGAWLVGYVHTARSADDVRDALAVAPRGGVVLDAVTRDLEDDAALGRLYVRAGRAAEAIPLLVRASRSCAARAHPIAFMHALASLGEVLEAAGDRAGACEAYARVADRWGAEPRSVTLRAARAGLARCGT